MLQNNVASKISPAYQISKIIKV